MKSYENHIDSKYLALDPSDLLSSEDVILPINDLDLLSITPDNVDLLDNHYQELVSTLSDLVSAEDFMGAELATVELSHENYWYPVLSNDVFFDTNLTYSSHEIIDLKGDNKVYESSPNDSLIFLGAGSNEIKISEKNADIFLAPDSFTKLEGQNSEVNIFTDANLSKDLELQGVFSKISLNVYFEDDKNPGDAAIVDGLVFFDNSDTPILDISTIEYHASDLEINIYTDDGLQTSQNLSVSLPERIHDAAPEHFYQPIQKNELSEILFENEVEIITLTGSQSIDPSESAERAVDAIEGLIYKSTAPEGYDNQVEQLLTDLVTEPEQILETGRLFDDPLDVFDETDLI